MEILHLPATQVTPEVRLNPKAGHFSMRGESYPENVLSFYAPILTRIGEALDSGNLHTLDVDMHITYFNSASAKAAGSARHDKRHGESLTLPSPSPPPPRRPQRPTVASGRPQPRLRCPPSAGKVPAPPAHAEPRPRTPGNGCAL